MTIVSGDEQTGVVADELAEPVVVEVADANDVPLSQVRVDFLPQEGSGTALTPSVRTDETGQASTRWRLGTSTSTLHRLEVRVVEDDGSVALAATVRAQPLADDPDTLVVVAGQDQQGVVGAALPDSLIVRVEDRFGNGVPETQVLWATQDGTASPEQAMTDSAGIARSEWVLGTEPGSQNLMASVGELSATFNAQADAGAVDSVSVSPSDTTLFALQDTAVFTAVAFDHFGNDVTERESFVWSSSDESVASVVDMAEGRFVAVANGTVSVTAEASGVVASATLFIEQVVASVAVSPPADTLALEETQQFSATAADSNGVTVEDSAVEWSSSDLSVVSISSAGLAEGVGSGSAYVIAVVDEVRDSASVLVLDTLEWTSEAALPVGVSGATGSAAGPRVFVMGGGDVGMLGTGNHVLDTTSGGWSAGAPLPEATSGASAVTVTGLIHLLGGTGEPSGHRVYDPDVDTWSELAQLPEPRWAAVAEVVEGKIYFIGGRPPSPNEPTGTVQIYDPATDSWSTGAAMPTPRISATSGVVNGKIYVAGGETAGITTSAALEVYDPETDSWSQLTPMPAERESLGGGAVYGEFCVFGGRLANASPTGDAFSDTFCYDPLSDSWRQGPDMITARVNMAVAQLGESIYAVGGRSGNSAVDANERLRR